MYFAIRANRFARIAIQIPIFVAHQADSRESLEFAIRANHPTQRKSRHQVRVASKVDTEFPYRVRIVDMGLIAAALFAETVSDSQILVARIHFCPFPAECFTDFLFSGFFFQQKEGMAYSFTHSLGNHGRVLHTFSFLSSEGIHSSTRT